MLTLNSVLLVMPPFFDTKNSSWPEQEVFRQLFQDFIKILSELSLVKK